METNMEDDDHGRCEDCGRHVPEHMLITLNFDGVELLICLDCKEAGA